MSSPSADTTGLEGTPEVSLFLSVQRVHLAPCVSHEHSPGHLCEMSTTTKATES